VASATTNAIVEGLKQAVYQWKDERFKTFRPMGEFFNRSKLSIPGPTEIFSRAKQNLAYFQTNYLLVCLVLSLYSALTSPMFLISAIAVGFLWSWSLKVRNGPVLVKGYAVPEKALTFGLIALTLFIFYLGSATAVLFWLVTATFIFVIGHAITMTPIPFDEFGFGTPTQPQFDFQPV